MNTVKRFERFRRLKRCVVPGLRHLVAGGLRKAPDAGERRVAGVSPTTATRREVAELAWPIAVTMLGDTAMGLVDTRLVARLGAAALGGVGIATTLMWLCYSIVFGLMRGVKVRTAHAVGEGRPQDGVAYAAAGAALAMIIGAIVWALGRDAGWAFVRLGIDPSTIPYARAFLAARSWGAVSVCMLSALIQHRQGLGDTRLPMMVGLTGNVLNAGLAWALIYGHFGLPTLGVRGAGYATASAETLEALVLLIVVIRERSRHRGVAHVGARRALAEVCELGVPTGLQFGVEMLAFTAFTAILGGLGANEIAGHQVALAIIRTSFLPGLAIAEAASVLVGRALGARNLAEADRVTRAAIALAAGFMTVCGVVFAFGGTAIAGQFATDPALLTVVRRLLYVAAVFQTFDAVTIVLRGALRGAKDVRAVMLIGITVVWICVPGAAWLLGREAGLGAVGGWLGFVGETTVSAALFWRRWTHGAWRARYAVEVAGDAERGTSSSVAATQAA